MNARDVQFLNEKLRNLYGDRFAGLTQALADVWVDALATVDVEVMDAALLRWARQHHTQQAPTLQNLLDVVELVEEDYRAAHAGRRGPVSRDTATILADAAAEAEPANHHWAQAHVQMFLEGFCRPHNHAETAQRCREYAVAFPEDSLDWRKEAVWWEQGASIAMRPLGPWVVPSIHGEEIDYATHG